METPVYIGYFFTVEPLQPGSDILIAELGAVGFESFVETDTGIEAYIQEQEWHKDILDEVAVLNSELFEISFTYKKIEQTNWNEEWEKNFHPIIVDNLCSVRAPFHEKPDTKYDIIIEPKMSFGTGHHETTHMMIQHLLSTEVTDKSVLDMGCGTGVLAILAEMEGAKPIDAIDIDNWCYLNTLENVDRNNCTHITAHEGDAHLLENKTYDLIIANINRNILLNDISTYNSSLNNPGTLLLSGFYKDDIPLIETECKKHGLELVKTLEKNQWVALKFEK